LAIIVNVQDQLATVSGLDPLQLNDLYVDCPEPSPPGLGGVRAISSNLLYLFEKLPHAIWQDPHGKLMEARAYRFISRLNRPKPTDEDRNFPFKTKPDDYQLEIFAAARHMPVMALAPVATGAGKSKMMVDITAAKYLAGEIDGVAVVAAPGALPQQWIDEALPDHMSPAVKWIGAVWKSTRKTDRRLMSPTEKKMRWLTFKVEAFSSAKGKAYEALEAYLKSGRIFLIEDESSRIKTPTANRTKAFIGEWRRGVLHPGLGSLAAGRAILTGTPITRGLEDLWSQYEFLDPKIIGLSNYYAFRGRYCVTMDVPGRAKAFGAKKIIGYRNTEEFVRKIAPVTFVVPKEVLKLDKPVFVKMPVELTREQKMAYNAIRNKLIDDLKDMKIASPVNAAVRYVRLQQVLSGRIYEQPSDLEEPPFPRLVPSKRLETMLEFIDDNPGPNVIWARFTDDILDIEKALLAIGRKPVTYYGDVSDDERTLRKKAFMRGEATDFVANAAVAGMGVDGLQKACSRALNYSHTWNREHRWQSVDRLYRRQQLAAATIIDFYVPRSIDDLIFAAYEKTEDMVNMVYSRPELIKTLGDE
jgi:hypothetical protein